MDNGQNIKTAAWLIGIRWQESMRTIHGTVGHYDHVRDQVMASRGAILFNAAETEKTL